MKGTKKGTKKGNYIHSPKKVHRWNYAAGTTMCQSKKVKPILAADGEKVTCKRCIKMDDKRVKDILKMVNKGLKF